MSKSHLVVEFDISVQTSHMRLFQDCDLCRNGILVKKFNWIHGVGIVGVLAALVSHGNQKFSLAVPQQFGQTNLNIVSCVLVKLLLVVLAVVMEGWGKIGTLAQVKVLFWEMKCPNCVNLGQPSKFVWRTPV